MAIRNVPSKNNPRKKRILGNKLFEVVEKFLNADRSEHLAVRLNNQEMDAVDEMKELVKEYKNL